MEQIAEFWLALDAAGQAALIGLATSAVVAVVQRLAPGLAIVPNNVKRVLIAAGAGLSAYATTGNWPAALAAALSAFGAYHVAREVARPQ